MQGTQTYYGNAKPNINRKSLVMLSILLGFLVLGAVVGYFAAGVRHATLSVQVENDTGATQDIRLYVNNDQVTVLHVAAGSTASYQMQVGWTSTTTAFYEVRATPVSTFWGDSETRSVSDGQTLVITLRVR